MRFSAERAFFTSGMLSLFYAANTMDGQIKRERMAGLLFVLALHGVALTALWRFHIVGAGKEPATVMVGIINPQPLPSTPAAPQPPRPARPKPVKPPEPQQMVAGAPVVKTDEPVAYVPPAPVVVAPLAPPPSLPAQPQPVVLSGELAVVCQERSPPDYPVQSKRMNEEGRVVLQVELGEDGHIVHAQVKASSGFPRLDAAALDAVKNWRCKPIMRNGTAVRAVAVQPFNFRLEGG